MTANTEIHLLVYRYQSVSGVTTIFLLQCDTSPSHRVNQAPFDCGPWNVVSLHFNGCAKLLDIGRNWNTLSYTSIQSIPNMLNGWHILGVCRPFSASRNCVQILVIWGCALSCKKMRWMARKWASGSHHGISFKLPSIKCYCLRCS